MGYFWPSIGSVWGGVELSIGLGYKSFLLFTFLHSLDASLQSLILLGKFLDLLLQILNIKPSLSIKINQLLLLLLQLLQSLRKLPPPHLQPQPLAFLLLLPPHNEPLDGLITGEHLKAIDLSFEPD